MSQVHYEIRFDLTDSSEDEDDGIESIKNPSTFAGASPVVESEKNSISGFGDEVTFQSLLIWNVSRANTITVRTHSKSSKREHRKEEQSCCSVM